MPLSCNLPPMQSGQMSGAEEPANKIWTGFATIFGGSNVEYRPSQVKTGAERAPLHRPPMERRKAPRRRGWLQSLFQFHKWVPAPGLDRRGIRTLARPVFIVLALDIELACGSAILHSLHCSSAVQVQSKSPSRSRREWRFVARPAAPATPLPPSLESLLPAANFQVTKSQLPTALDIQVLLQRVTACRYILGRSPMYLHTHPSPSPAHLAHGLGVWMMLRLPVCGQ